ncbi:MAG: hypothetical protein IJT41_13260 [Clostridia bacterium]|nr:hypothetical protein [Clostridia bacterium]
MFNESELLEIRALIVAIDKLLLDCDMLHDPDLLGSAITLSGMLNALTERITGQVDEAA